MINLSTLKKFSHVKKYRRGTVIARECLGIELIVVLKGDVGIFRDYRKWGEEMIATIGPGGFFGETALLLEKSAPYTAAALTEVIALAINRSTALSFMAEEPEMAYELMKAMCARLDNASAAYEKLSGQTWVDPECIPRAAPPVQTAEPPQAHPADSAGKEGSVQDASAEAATETYGQSSSCSLFPEGHGSYQLELNSEGRVYLMDKAFTCPMCKKEFRTLQVRQSRLVMDSTDKDMRRRYKGVEPLYYDTVTCPDCLYSALSDMFSHPDSTRADLRELKALEAEVKPLFAGPVSTTSVFAGYYLALLCAPKCFTAQNLAAAKLCLKLSRIYADCGDPQMEEKAAKNSLDAYMAMYLNENNDLAQEQQLCIIIGELYLKLGDLKNAKDYFFKAKTNRAGTPLLKTQAENRLLDIRTMEGGA